MNDLYRHITCRMDKRAETECVVILQICFSSSGSGRFKPLVEAMRLNRLLTKRMKYVFSMCQADVVDRHGCQAARKRQLRHENEWDTLALVAYGYTRAVMPTLWSNLVEEQQTSTSVHWFERGFRYICHAIKQRSSLCCVVSTRRVAKNAGRRG